MPFTKYGVTVREPESQNSRLNLERHCIRMGGKWIGSKGVECGVGLFDHYRNMMTLCWPEDDHHRWSDQILRGILNERITVLQGCKDSSKTRTVSKWGLCDYWCFPNNTLIMLTSTTIKGSELRGLGDMKSLFEKAKERFPFLEGSVVDAEHGMFTGNIEGGALVRDMRKGIVCVPVTNAAGDFTGKVLNNFAGIKQGRRRLLCEEMQYMPSEYLSIFADFDKGDFKFAGSGNPIGGNGSALDRVSEPMAGWGSIGEITKTTEWRNKFDGLTICLYGLDSPNFDADKPKHYPYLTDADDAAKILKRFGKDSLEYCAKVLGIRSIGAVNNRVLTVEQIRTHGGFEDCLWNQGIEMRIYAVDGGFGGDACVGQYIECGAIVGGVKVIRFSPPEEIQVSVTAALTVDDQIAIHVKRRCRELGVPDANVFVEPGMRASLLVIMTRHMTSAINAISFGGPATPRPVCNDLFVKDPQTGNRRLKTCHEHYSKFVTELWFTVKELVDSGQARNFPMPTAEEFEARTYEWVSGDRYEIETKADFKKRMSYSPNRADAAVIAVEGARRLGFVIERMKTGEEEESRPLWAWPKKTPRPEDYLEDELSKQRGLERENELSYN